MSQHADDEPVMFGYSSSRNISFNGQDELGITWGEWRQMTRAADDPDPAEEAAR